MVRNTKLALKILGRHVRSKERGMLSRVSGASRPVIDEKAVDAVESTDRIADKAQAKPIVEGILPIDKLLEISPEKPSEQARLDVHLPVILPRTEGAKAGDGCPFMDLNDSRCSQHFSLSHMESAFATCLSDHEACPIFEDLLKKFSQPISFALASRNVNTEKEAGRDRKSVCLENERSTDRRSFRQKA